MAQLGAPTAEPQAPRRLIDAVSVGVTTADGKPPATLVTKVLAIPEADASRLLDELEASGCLTSATCQVQ
jgi:hypothetical protein